MRGDSPVSINEREFPPRCGIFAIATWPDCHYRLYSSRATHVLTLLADGYAGNPARQGCLFIDTGTRDTTVTTR